MRVVLSSPRAGWGGSATVAGGLARGLADRGHEVVLFCKPGSALHRELGRDVTTEPILKGVDFPPPAVARAISAFRRHRTQVVVSLLSMDLRLTGLAGRFAGLPVVGRRAAFEPFSRMPWRRFGVDRIPRHWIAPSEASRRTLLASGPWLGPGDVTTVHNGIDPGPFEAAPPAELGLPEGAVAVGYVGRLHPEKGVGELCRAWAGLAGARPELHLVVVGEGSYEAEMRRILGDAPRVRWLGYREEVAPVLAALDLFVLPSWQESFGLAAVEAMAAGLPVVASRTGGLEEVVVDGGTGVLVPPRDPEALAAAVVELAADPERRRRLGRAGRERVRERFTVERMVDGYEAVLERAVEAGG